MPHFSFGILYWQEYKWGIVFYKHISNFSESRDWYFMWIVSYKECPDYVHSSRKEKYLNKYLFLIFQWNMYGM